MKASGFGIARFLRKTLVDQHKPCLLLLDSEFRLRLIGGDPEHYGYGGLKPGCDCCEQMPFLYGLEADEAIHLPLIETASGIAADLLLSPMDGGGQGLLLTDVNRERAARQVVQQQANELKLLHREQQRMMKEVRAVRDELAEKHRQALEAGRVKSRFIAGLSHELRTPLTAVLGHAELLRDPQRASESSAESLLLIEANANHLLSLVDNMLDQASLEAGRLTQYPIPASLADFCREMEIMFRPSAARKGLQFGLRLRGTPPDWVRIDATRLRQVVINLMNNAIKYTERGRVALSVGWSDDRLDISVSDTGPGISPAARERIFLAFHREADASGEKGAGLGLAISHQLVALMGGEMRLDDRQGGGSVFGFQVPAPMLVDSPGGIGDDGGGHRILLVDDSRDIRVLYGRILEKDGFKVETAADEPEAWRLFEAERPELVIVDLYLKEWDGSGLVRRLRGRGYGGGILSWSASSLREDRIRAMGAGADACLTKPVEARVLRASVRDLVRRRKAG